MGYVIEQERKHTLDPEYVKHVILEKANHSYAINHKITEVLSSDSWKGQECFIIGGGPSLSDFDMSLLDGMNTIGINRAFQFCPNTSINYSMDSDFYDKMMRGDYDKPNQKRVKDVWLDYRGLRVFLTPMELKQYGQEVFLVKRLFYKSLSTDLSAGIYGGCNSGLGALMLAAALGVSTIYLLGYDMRIDKKTHWHGGYPDKNLEEFVAKLSEYRKEIEDMSPLFEKVGIKIYNLTENSTISCFPFIDANSILNRGAIKNVSSI